MIWCWTAGVSSLTGLPRGTMLISCRCRSSQNERWVNNIPSWKHRIPQPQTCKHQDRDTPNISQLPQGDIPSTPNRQTRSYGHTPVTIAAPGFRDVFHFLKSTLLHFLLLHYYYLIIFKCSNHYWHDLIYCIVILLKKVNYYFLLIASRNHGSCRIISHPENFST